MKKLFSFLMIAFLGMIAISCVDRIDDPVNDQDTYSVAYDLNNVSFTNNSTTGYTISRTFNNPLYNGDVVLVYRMDGTTTNGSPIWQQIPRTLYLNQGELDYDFDFSKNDVQIYAGGTYDLATTPQYINNQTFRVVIVPASTGKVDYSNYEAVASMLGITEKDIKKL